MLPAAPPPRPLARNDSDTTVKARGSTYRCAITPSARPSVRVITYARMPPAHAHAALASQRLAVKACLLQRAVLRTDGRAELPVLMPAC